MAVDPSQMQDDPFGARPGSGRGTQHPPAGTLHDTVAGGWVYHWRANGDGTDSLVSTSRTDAAPAAAGPQPKGSIQVVEGKPYYIGQDEQGKPTFTPIPGFEPKPGWTYREQDGGLIILPTDPTAVNPNTGQPYGPTWVIAPDPSIAAARAAQIANSGANTASTYQGMDIARSTDARNNAIYERDTNRYQQQDAMELAREANRQGQGAYENMVQLGYTMPRQYLADVNQARAYQSQEAGRNIEAAAQRETTGRQAGADALGIAQWQLQHGVGPAAQRSMGNVGRGSAPNPGAYLFPMPDLGDIFRQAQSEGRGQIPTYQQAVGATPHYATFEPDLEAMYQHWGRFVAPNSPFLFGRGGQ